MRIKIAAISSILFQGTSILFQGTTLSFAFSVPPTSMETTYPRPLHPGGFSLPPMVEDLLPIATAAGGDSSDSSPSEQILQKDLLIVRPPDMESLWEWYVSKRQTNSDPSWGRVWPTAITLARFILQSLNCNSNENKIVMDGLEGQEQVLVKEAIKSLQTSSHIVELGSGLGVAGLAFAAAAAETSDNNIKRTVTFLDREPYALHCVMASAAINNLATGPISEEEGSGIAERTITARSSIDDWTSSDKNINYDGLKLDSLDYDNKQTLILGSDILYEPSSMDTLSVKLRSLLHPKDGGYVFITDPERERTAGCRSAFQKSVEELGGNVVVLPLPQPERNGMKKSILVESDIDIDGTLAKTVLIVVHFDGDKIDNEDK
jgi:hypothetical protein